MSIINSKITKPIAVEVDNTASTNENISFSMTKKLKDTNIRNWSIFAGASDGEIVAINNRNNERFEGSVETFNKALRGE